MHILQVGSPAISAGFVESDLYTVGPRKHASKQAGLLAAHAKGVGQKPARGAQGMGSALERAIMHFKRMCVTKP